MKLLTLESITILDIRSNRYTKKFNSDGFIDPCFYKRLGNAAFLAMPTMSIIPFLSPRMAPRTLLMRTKHSLVVLYSPYLLIINNYVSNITTV